MTTEAKQKITAQLYIRTGRLVAGLSECEEKIYTHFKKFGQVCKSRIALKKMKIWTHLRKFGQDLRFEENANLNTLEKIQTN